jgi:hypothetical protein
MLLVDDSYFVKSGSVADVADVHENIAVVTDVGAALGSPCCCCLVRSRDTALHSAAIDYPLQPLSAAVLHHLSSPSPHQQDVLNRNSALFRAWIHGEAERLRWNDPGSNCYFSRSMVSIAPGVELESRRFYSELERRGSKRSHP